MIFKAGKGVTRHIHKKALSYIITLNQVKIQKNIYMKYAKKIAF